VGEPSQAWKDFLAVIRSSTGDNLMWVTSLNPKDGGSDLPSRISRAITCDEEIWRGSA